MLLSLPESIIKCVIFKYFNKYDHKNIRLVCKKLNELSNTVTIKRFFISNFHDVGGIDVIFIYDITKYSLLCELVDIYHKSLSRYLVLYSLKLPSFPKVDIIGQVRRIMYHQYESFTYCENGCLDSYNSIKNIKEQKDVDEYINNIKLYNDIYKIEEESYECQDYMSDDLIEMYDNNDRIDVIKTFKTFYSALLEIDELGELEIYTSDNDDDTSDDDIDNYELYTTDDGITLYRKK